MNLFKLSNQRGDTLIEVAIAMAILSITLFHAYNLSSQSSQMGLASREQGQVTQLMEHQASGLRHMRDQSESWTDFKNDLQVTPGSSIVGPIHLRVQGGEWVAVNNEGSGDDIINDAFSRYTIEITGNLVENGDKLEASIEATWETPRGENEATELSVILVNVDTMLPPSASVTPNLKQFLPGYVGDTYRAFTVSDRRYGYGLVGATRARVWVC